MGLFSKKPTTPPIVDVNITGDSRFDLTVVGTEYHGPAVKRVIGKRDQVDTTATLQPDPGNQHDPGAVRVDIDGTPVGYLSRFKAERFKASVEREYGERWRATVAARLERREHPTDPVVVRLDVPDTWLKP